MAQTMAKTKKDVVYVTFTSHGRELVVLVVEQD